MNLSKAIQANLRSGGVIPAHPLAVTDQRKLDERRQRALTRYYLASGASGVAVGVHTTQFQIRDPKIDLLKPVLQLASETVDEFEERHPKKSIIRIAGICGEQAADAMLAMNSAPGNATGTPDRVIETLTRLRGLGCDYVICYFPEAAYDRSGIELFEREVIPALA